MVEVARAGVPSETRESLVAAVIDLLKERPPEKLRVEDVLKASGKSASSLYHHFEDFSHLVETVLIKEYLEILNGGAVLLEAAILEARPSKDVNQATTAAGTRFARFNTPEIRFQRARTLGMCESHPRMKEALGKAQQASTDRLASIFEQGQVTGTVNQELDARVLAVFVQSYTFGRIVDDIVPNQMRQEDWMFLLGRIYEKAILTDG